MTRDEQIHDRALLYGNYIKGNTGELTPGLLAFCLLLAREVQEVDELAAEVAILKQKLAALES